MNTELFPLALALHDCEPDTTTFLTFCVFQCVSRKEAVILVRNGKNDHSPIFENRHYNHDNASWRRGMQPIFSFSLFFECVLEFFLFARVYKCSISIYSGTVVFRATHHPLCQYFLSVCAFDDKEELFVAPCSVRSRKTALFAVSLTNLLKL